jgi:hypothetical protein
LVLYFQNGESPWTFSNFPTIYKFCGGSSLILSSSHDLTVVLGNWDEKKVKGVWPSLKKNGIEKLRHPDLQHGELAVLEAEEQISLLAQNG